MADRLPRARRQGARSRGIIVLLSTLVLALLVVVAVLMFSGGLQGGTAKTDSERDYRLLLQGLKEDPKDPAVLMSLAEAEYDLRKEGDALAHAKQAVTLAGKTPAFRIRYANLLLRSDRIKEARVLVLQEIGLHTKGDAEPYFLMAQIERSEKRYQSAIDYMNKGLAIAPTAADMMIVYGDILAEKGDEDAAVAQYRQALRYLPDNPDAISGLKRLGAEVPASNETTSPHGTQP